MTEKELLYIEDALGHLEHIDVICKQYKEKLQDRNLVAFIKSVEERNRNIKAQFMKILGGKCYE